MLVIANMDFITKEQLGGKAMSLSSPLTRPRQSGGMYLPQRDEEEKRFEP